MDKSEGNRQDFAARLAAGGAANLELPPHWRKSRPRRGEPKHADKGEGEDDDNRENGDQPAAEKPTAPAPAEPPAEAPETEAVVPAAWVASKPDSGEKPVADKPDVAVTVKPKAEAQPTKVEPRPAAVKAVKPANADPDEIALARSKAEVYEKALLELGAQAGFTPRKGEDWLDALDRIQLAMAFALESELGGRKALLAISEVLGLRPDKEEPLESTGQRIRSVFGRLVRENKQFKQAAVQPKAAEEAEAEDAEAKEKEAKAPQVKVKTVKRQPPAVPEPKAPVAESATQATEAGKSVWTNVQEAIARFLKAL